MLATVRQVNDLEIKVQEQKGEIESLRGALHMSAELYSDLRRKVVALEKHERTLERAAAYFGTTEVKPGG